MVVPEQCPQWGCPLGEGILMEGMPFTLFKLNKNAQWSSDPGGKCWNPAFSESCLGLFNGYVWIAQKKLQSTRLF